MTPYYADDLVTIYHGDALGRDAMTKFWMDENGTHWREPAGRPSLADAEPLRNAAIDAYDKWRDYFDADERGEFWTPLCAAMGRLGAIAKDRPELDEWPAVPEEAWRDAAMRRRPLPGEGYLWVVLHRLRRHRVDRWGWYLSHGGARRAWHCLDCRRTWP